MSPERVVLAKLLARVSRRLTVIEAARGAVVGTLPAALVLLVAWRQQWSWSVAAALGAACIAAGIIGGVVRAQRRRDRVAYDVELRAPDCRNLLITAAELADPASNRASAGVREDVARMVEVRAADVAGRLDAGVLFPLSASVLSAVVLVAGWVALAAAAPRLPESNAAPAPIEVVADVDPVLSSIEVRVTPPGYTGEAERVLNDPQRLDVVEGSRLEVVAVAAATAVTLDTLEGSLALDAVGDGRFRGEIVAAADGFLAVEPRAGERRGPRRLIGLVVTPDAPPLVRLVEPGQDLFLPEAGEGIPLTAVADDDYGVADLRITYTIVSGSGENFEFSEGELEANVQPSSDRSWNAQASLDPTALGLSLGDMVVYRAVARDRRPGAADVESDSFVVEIVGDNAAIAGGFALESDEEREALSQRMIIIKTERLLARKDELSPEDYLAEARILAAEQRIVRAEFVFMMGGEIQDEVEEAEHEHEVAQGRLALRGRQEMSRSVLYMSQAAAMLTDTNLEAALPLENAALEALQSALSRSRYILRTLIDRQSIDITRRLTGDPGIARGEREGVASADDTEVEQLRGLLAQAAALSASGAAAGNSLADLAEAILRVDPGSAEFQDIVAGLDAGSTENPEVRLAAAVDALRALLDARMPGAPAAARQDPAMAGALNDVLTGGGGR